MIIQIREAIPSLVGRGTYIIPQLLPPTRCVSCKNSWVSWKLWNWKKVHIWKNYDLRRMVSTLWCWWWVNPSHLETTWWSCLITTRRQYQKAGCLKASPLGSSAHYRTKTNNLFSNQKYVVVNMIQTSNLTSSKKPKCKGKIICI